MYLMRMCFCNSPEYKTLCSFLLYDFQSESSYIIPLFKAFEKLFYSFQNGSHPSHPEQRTKISNVIPQSRSIYISIVALLQKRSASTFAFPLELTWIARDSPPL